ncbi:hypothetical protein DPSP01_012062 [Paraphaeosphaeria sporulosa]|uniref:RlpA-like protein double-psi beta-barrel domain-containing protein n=1 Tax=Paraphaeosphaeria sporulosa TaxID=1460663 RepID=A0A177CLF9_9PLEO|nr:uncharacterized protein CC84DRAFT_1163739 [Paraphaeosphaeria sporulosa]OAG07617.1 hypothetical protein CC84DRAFT_1163739 [Paraphaeosphaeria sporulosa]
MKSSIVASALFASLALAAPLNKRAYATKTNTVVETVVVYTTVWGNQPPATSAPAAATSSPALFFEKPSSAAAVTSSEVAPKVPSSTPEPVVPSFTPAPEPVSSEAPSSSAVPVVESTPSPSPEPTPTPQVTPEAAPSSTTPVVEATPSAEPSTGGGSSGGQEYTGSLTMNYYSGGLGACGEAIQDTEMVAALAVAGFGDSTYDSATGNPTNKWCNQKIRVTYNGKSADAVIKDRCPGCTGQGGLDATPALWEALTGGQGGASGDRLESGMSFTLLN